MVCLLLHQTGSGILLSQPIFLAPNDTCCLRTCRSSACTDGGPIYAWHGAFQALQNQGNGRCGRSSSRGGDALPDPPLRSARTGAASGSGCLFLPPPGAEMRGRRSLCSRKDRLPARVGRLAYFLHPIFASAGASPGVESHQPRPWHSSGSVHLLRSERANRPKGRSAKPRTYGKPEG